MGPGESQGKLSLEATDLGWQNFVFCLLLSPGHQVLEEVQTAAGHFDGRLAGLFSAMCCPGWSWNAD